MSPRSIQRPQSPYIATGVNFPDRKDIDDTVDSYTATCSGHNMSPTQQSQHTTSHHCDRCKCLCRRLVGLNQSENYRIGCSRCNVSLKCSTSSNHGLFNDSFQIYYSIGCVYHEQQYCLRRRSVSSSEPCRWTLWNTLCGIFWEYFENIQAKREDLILRTLSVIAN